MKVVGSQEAIVYQSWSTLQKNGVSLTGKVKDVFITGEVRGLCPIHLLWSSSPIIEQINLMCRCSLGTFCLGSIQFDWPCKTE